NMVIDIDGQLGAREYNSKFGEVTFRTLDNTIISVSATMTDGTGAHLMEADKSSGTYNLKSMKVNYRVEIEGDVVTSASTFVDIAGKFEAPYYKDYDPEIPTSAFDPSRDLFFQYSSGSGATDIFMESVVGPVEIKATFGPTSAAMGVTGSVASISGQSKDIAYDVNVAGMGLSQMQLSLSNSIVKLFVPLDNVDESKPAGAKIALSGLTLSDQVWAMFDPTAALPRDEINLDIDLSASLRWLKKIAEVDVSNTDQEPPLVMDSAEIKSLNLTIAGAELQTTGSVLVDNSQFPPVPEGTVNISLKGVQGLIGKLTEIGLIPAQNAMMIQGMTAMFFRPGEGGEDHLTSAIEMTKDGHIIANGMPIK
ncbi:MAG: DUF2125 domain-containing protein, partial [Proteobacteria bacterium]|nr:DUF2125 domain-containing protein [Pseudomonadota bacterium]